MSRNQIAWWLWDVGSVMIALSWAPASQVEVERLAATVDWEKARRTLRPPHGCFDGDEPKPF